MKHVLALAAVVAAALLAHAHVPAPTLLFDARVLVGENPILRSASAASVRYLLTHGYWQPMATDGLYRPVTMLSFLLDHAVLGHEGRTTGYVVENLALHCACAALIYALLWTLTRRRWPALAAALVFAVHPVTTEVVANVVGRADLLAALGVLAGVLCWVHGARAAGPRRAVFAFLLGASAALAFFSKENGLVLLAVVVLWDVAFPPARGRRFRAEYLVVAVLAVAYLTARYHVNATGLPTEDLSAVDNPIVEAPFLQGRLTAVATLVRELALLLWPATLSVDYSYDQIPIVAWPPVGPGDWLALAGVVGFTLSLWGLIRLRRSAPALFFLGAFTGVALLPTANLVLVIGAIMAERFLYLPLVGVCGMAAVVADTWARTRERRVVATLLLAIVVLAAGIRTSVRARDWQAERRLWAATVEAAPASAKARKAYAAALFDPNADTRALAEVIAHAERAVAIRPDYQQALVDLGSYYIAMGDKAAQDEPAASRRWHERAVEVLERALVLDRRSTARFVEKMRARGNPDGAIPDVGDGMLYNNLSIAYVRAGRLDDALGAYRRMRDLSPTSAPIYRDIATLESALGRRDEAAVAFWQAIAIADDAEAKRGLAQVYGAASAGGGSIITTGPAGDLRVDLSHPLVRRHRCRASRELDTIFTNARLPALAEQARREASSCTFD